VTEDGPRILTVWAAGFACDLKLRLIGVSIGRSVMTDPVPSVVGRAIRRTHVVGRASRSSHVAGRATSDAALIRVLYNQHGPALWRYALRLTGDQSRAEDVVQETLLHAWQHPEVVDDGKRSTRAWLFTVARNMIIDKRRSSRFRNEVATLETAGTAERAAPDEVNVALDRLLIGDGMAELSAEHRAVIRRSYYLGWSTSQIAEDLGIAEGTVKSRLHYAVRALRLTLQEMGLTR
jgi:RNA polymerase sigma-70 factor (ECF subfamily)